MSDDAMRFHVPGRIEVLGKHTDYAGGRSLLVASVQGFTVRAAPRGDAQLRVTDLASGETVRLALDPTLAAADGWARYPATAARRLARDFPGARTGADIAFSSDLPSAAGMSSSSALIVATFLALAAVNRLDEDPRWPGVASPEQLPGYLAAVESGQPFGALEGDLGVGTQGGSEDHTAMLFARAGQLVQYAFAPVRFERAIPMPAGHRFVVAASGVRAEKAGAARERYNRASSLMRAAAALWREATRRDDATIGAALDAIPEAGAWLRVILAKAADGDALVRRVEHFIAEDREIIPAAGDALARGDLAEFGRQVDRSQALAERLLDNQVEETIHLARSARELGAVAASAFGAGFGGSVWALVTDGAAAQFEEAWRAAYLARFPQHAGGSRFLTTAAGPPAARLR